MGSIGFVDTAFAKKLQQRGIQCRVFNPIVPVLNVFMNNRDHRKITVIDGQVGYTGGYNLADEYFNLTHPYGRWKDSGVRLEGDAVRNLTLIFLEMWGTTQKEMPAIEPYLPAIRYTAREAATVLPYADNPLDDKRVGEDVYLNLINSAQRYVYITTPYLILSDEMQRALVLAAQRGVDVRIITPGIPDKKLIFSSPAATMRGWPRAVCKSTSTRPVSSTPSSLWPTTRPPQWVPSTWITAVCTCILRMAAVLRLPGRTGCAGRF